MSKTTGADERTKQLRKWKRQARTAMKKGEFYFVLDDDAWLDPYTGTRGSLDQVQAAWFAERHRLGLDVETEGGQC